MKFGKQILNQQVPEWSSQYINYKALKKIISNLQKAKKVTIAAGPPPSLADLSAPVPVDERAKYMQEQGATFFFRLERELEKVNSFYLQKEDEFKVRKETLLARKKILMTHSRRVSPRSVSLTTLREAFQQLQQDLGKFQQFIKINETGFRKILKKWDKRSKSSTKELYLSRQVGAPPCFKRETITELADTIAANLAELDNHANVSLLPSPSPERRMSVSGSQELDTMDDIETELTKAISAGPSSTVQEIVNRFRQHENRDISPVFWRACSEGSDDSLQTLANTGIVNFGYADDISERTCLHEAAIAGRLFLAKLCHEHEVKIDRQDVYGRTPLHYAAMYGHSEVTMYLLSVGANVVSIDHDGFGPLIHAVTNGHTKCVQILIEHHAPIEPQKEGDHVPLCLACRYGHKDIAILLLDKGASFTTEADGLYPLHLTSREGHHELSRILTYRGAPVDARDRYNAWTPLFYAASEGHIECVKVLLLASCTVNPIDEQGHSPIFYAAQEGHIECISVLNSVGGRAEPVEPVIPVDSVISVEPRSRLTVAPPASGQAEDNPDIMDTIPSLMLPPPIIPVRIYGHRYLDKKYHVQLTLGHTSTRKKRSPVQLYGNSRISSFKLIVTSKHDAISRSAILPLGDDREEFSFEVDSLENFLLEFEIFPTFGSRVIGKGVVLPHVFDVTSGRAGQNELVGDGTGGRIVCPLSDTHLKVVGEIAFEFSVVKPFQSAQLEIGGRLETYWKSTVNAASQVIPEQPQVASETSGINQFFITASSLSGEYVQVIVQVTRDMVAVVYPNWMLPVPGFDLTVSDVTFRQFKALGAQMQRDQQDSDNFDNADSTAALQKMVHEAYLSLEEVLQRLPSSIGVNLEIKYPTVFEMSRDWLSDVPNINSYVDTILQTVYDHAQSHAQLQSISDDTESTRKPNRPVMFSSYNPAICTAVNWKQPNYAVFFNSFCGFDNNSIPRGKKRKDRDEGPDAMRDEVDLDKRCTSIKEAVKFAKINNLLGVIFEATLLVQVPSLITYVKQAGLVLMTSGTTNNDVSNVRVQARYGVDAMMVDGVIKYGSGAS